MLKRFNRWYDGLPEPKRFLIFLFILMGWVPLMFVPPPAPIVYTIGSIWMTITVVVALSRLR